jgi:hypothetical protein
VRWREDRWLASAIGLAACLDTRKRFAADGFPVSGFERGLRAVQALEQLGLQFLFGSAFSSARISSRMYSLALL